MIAYKNKQNLVLVFDPEEQQIRSCPDNSVDPVTETTPTTSPAPFVTDRAVIPYVRNGDQPLQICYDDLPRDPNRTTTAALAPLLFLEGKSNFSLYVYYRSIVKYDDSEPKTSWNSFPISLRDTDEQFLSEVSTSPIQAGDEPQDGVNLTTSPKSEANRLAGTSSNSSDSQTRRNNLSARGALFNGSRSRKKFTGSDDDGEDDEEKKVRLRLLNQCEASTSNPLSEEDINKAERQRTVADHTSPMTPSEPMADDVAEWDNPRHSEIWTGAISPITRIKQDIRKVPRIDGKTSNQTPLGQKCNPNVNSTALDQSNAGYYLFDTSLLQGISRIWQSARNVSLFGASYSRHYEQTNPCSKQVQRIQADQSRDESFGSDLEDQMPDISEISFGVLQNQTVVEHIDTQQKVPSDSVTDTKQLHVPKLEYFVGVANPEITPVALHMRESRTLLTPLNRPGSKIRTKSESSPLVRGGPYELPHSVIVRKTKRTEIRFNLLDNRSDQTPIGRRKRTASDSFSSSPGNMSINCIRARDPGLYDCSSGLGEYFHLEHNFLDKADTGRIDKQKFLETVEKFLTISGDHQPQSLPNSVKLSWDDEHGLGRRDDGWRSERTDG
ncbi:hypothetical protein ACHWQZ_G002349 [Mnemiopsis leidyi]